MRDQTFGDYKILEKCGEGGMGIFYKALDQTLDRIVGLKTVRPELVSDADFRQRLEREAKSLARLDHQNIVTIYQYLKSGGNHFIVMEYVEGKTLSKIIETSAPLTFDRAAKIFTQVLRAIGYAHQHNVIHRDIKPANILITHDGTVKVTDFGIAKLVGSKQVTRTGRAPGSPYHMAPEQIQNRKIDHRTDIYALGVTLFQMLTGRPPFEADSEFDLFQKHIHQEPPVPSELNPALNEMHDELAIRALQKDPASRFQSIDSFSFALFAIRQVTSLEDTDPDAADKVPPKPPEEETTTTFTPPTSVAPPAKPRKKMGWLFAVLLVLGVIAAYLAFTQLAGDREEAPVNGQTGDTISGGVSEPGVAETPADRNTDPPAAAADAVSFSPSRLSMRTDFSTDYESPVTFVISVELDGPGDSLAGLLYRPPRGIIDRRLSNTEYEVTFFPFDGCPSPYEVWFIAQRLAGEDSLLARFTLDESEPQAP